MAKLTAEQFQEKHARRLKEAIPDMTAGIARVTVCPTHQAADMINKLKTNLNAAIDSGKMAKRMRSVTLDQWKTKMTDIGVNRVASGIDGAKDKVIAFANQLLPHIDKVVADVSKLPSTTLEDSINRVTTFIRGMAKFQRS
jgi:hypothetical protein